MNNLGKTPSAVPAQIEKLPFSQLIRRIGPDIVLTGVVIDPGAVTTVSMLGVDYGCSLLWLLISIAFMGVALMLMAYRIPMLTGIPLVETMRHYYGKVTSGFMRGATSSVCLLSTMGNISGTEADVNLVFGIDWRLGALIMAAVMICCYFSKNTYPKAEKGITTCIVVMIVAFHITLVRTGGPDWKTSDEGLTRWMSPAGSLVTAPDSVNTNAPLTTGVYGTHLGKEKKWKKDDLFNGVMVVDTIAHITGVSLINGAIILMGAIVLFPRGIPIDAPTRLADLLTPSMGRVAKYITGAALLGAGFSSLLGSTQRGVMLLNPGFNKSTALESKAVQRGSVVVLVAAGLICFSFDGSPVQLIYLVDVATVVPTPIVDLFICLLLWRKDINKGYKASRLLQIRTAISYLLYLLFTLVALINILPKFTSSLSTLF